MTDEKWYDIVTENYEEKASILVNAGWRREDHKQYKDQFTKDNQTIAIFRQLSVPNWYTARIAYKPINEALEWFYSLEPHEQQAQIEIRYQEFCSNL